MPKDIANFKLFCHIQDNHAANAHKAGTGVDEMRVDRYKGPLLDAKLHEARYSKEHVVEEVGMQVSLTDVELEEKVAGLLAAFRFKPVQLSMLQCLKY